MEGGTEKATLGTYVFYAVLIYALCGFFYLAFIKDKAPKHRTISNLTPYEEMREGANDICRLWYGRDNYDEECIQDELKIMLNN
ncbi:MAG: hypothetical protein RPU61_03215 [Candidatus Sedimenticola sp. (ex Thyasira tokunagai)]